MSRSVLEWRRRARAKDEPANGLDPQGIRALRDLLRARAGRGHTVVVSSHLLGEVQHLADDVVVIAQGRLVASGTIEELTRSASLVRCADPEKLGASLRRAGARVSDDEGLVVFELAMERIGELALADGIALRELSPHAGSLEDLFLAWTAGHDSPSETSR